MIKPHCPTCHQIYLGEKCQCGSDKRNRALVCECGAPAVEVYQDRLGEWALCEVCLRIAENDIDGPRFLDQLSNFATIKPVKVSYPFGLSARQYEVARLAHLSNQQIAAKLMISTLTVKAHMKIVFKKMGVRSRHEIRHLLPPEDDL